jgi:hypothetical protein
VFPNTVFARRTGVQEHVIQPPIPFSDRACYNTGMKTRRQQSRQKTAGSGDSHPKKDISGKKVAEQGSDNDCRCKEVSEKTFTGMLRLMLNDLTFWKRDKRRK